MSDKTILISAPVKSESGYGHKSREICAAIVSRYPNTTIDPLPWGKTPSTGLENSKYGFLQKYLMTATIKERPDIHVHIGLPMEFRPFGKKNILFTSGVEVDRIGIEWIIAINKNCDAVVVPSVFVKNIIEGTIYTDSRGKGIKVQRPVYVVPESYDTELLEPMNEREAEQLDSILSQIKEPKWFISTGQARVGLINTSADRKNTFRLIKEFCQHFDGKTDVALVLKTNPHNFSNLAYFELERTIKKSLEEITVRQRPAIYLIKGQLSTRQLGAFVRRPEVVGNVSITHGEGFGRFLLESLVMEQRVICTRYTGHEDFIKHGNVLKVEASKVQVPPEASMGGIISRDAEWYEIQSKSLKEQLYKAYSQPKNAKKAKKVANKLKHDFSFECVSNQILEIMELYQTQHLTLDLPEELND